MSDTKSTPESSDEQQTDFTNPWKYSDLIFLVEDKQLHANKIALSMMSPVMEAMFTHEFKEKNADKIDLPGKKYDAMLEFIKFIHPPCKIYINDDNVMPVLELSDEYQVKRLKTKCEKYLCKRNPSLKMILVADQYGLPNLKIRNIEFAASLSLEDFKSAPEYAHLSDKTRADIFEFKLSHQDERNMLREQIDELKGQVKQLEINNEKHLVYLKKISTWVKTDRPIFSCVGESCGHHKRGTDIGCINCRICIVLKQICYTKDRPDFKGFDISSVRSDFVRALLDISAYVE